MVKKVGDWKIDITKLIAVCEKIGFTEQKGKTTAIIKILCGEGFREFTLPLERLTIGGVNVSTDPSLYHALLSGRLQPDEFDLQKELYDLVHEFEKL